jgi:hypothetical protein
LIGLIGVLVLDRARDAIQERFPKTSHWIARRDPSGNLP